MYLGLDLGTSSVKAMLIDAEQRVIGSASAGLNVSRPHLGWSEQDPAEWLTATDAAISDLKGRHPRELDALRGIGLSGQMHGATLISADDRVLRPCILWNDTRSHAQAARLDADPSFREITGNIVFPGFTAPKLAWVRENEPELFDRVAWVLLPKDYLRLWLTGERISEMSDASGTSWLDVAKRAWSPELLGKTGLALGNMPSLVEGTEVAGRLRPELASRWAIKGAPVIAGGAGDNAASACGVGAVRAGAAFISLGTSGVLFAAADDHRADPASAVHAFCHALPGLWHQMGVILSATDCLSWLAGVTGRSESELAGELGDRLRAPTGVSFLPYLSGERTPHNDAIIRGAFVGLGHQADRRVMAQAVVEGVAFAFRDSLEAMRAAGTDLARLTAVGGGTRSRYWLAALATALDVPIDLPEEGDLGAAFGAARLGLIAAEAADPLAVCTPSQVTSTIEPVAGLRQAFGEAYHRYRALYPAIRGVTS